MLKSTTRERGSPWARRMAPGHRNDPPRDRPIPQQSHPPSQKIRPSADTFGNTHVAFPVDIRICQRVFRQPTGLGEVVVPVL